MKKHLLILALQLASAGADAYYTNFNAAHAHFTEHDPIARPFVTHSTFERAAYFSSYAGIFIAGSEVLRHYHHDRIALAVAGFQIEQNAYGAAYSATHYRVPNNSTGETKQ